MPLLAKAVEWSIRALEKLRGIAFCNLSRALAILMFAFMSRAYYFVIIIRNKRRAQIEYCV